MPGRRVRHCYAPTLILAEMNIIGHEGDAVAIEPICGVRIVLLGLVCSASGSNYADALLPAMTAAISPAAWARHYAGLGASRAAYR